MERERGSKPAEVEIFGGPYDGALGVVQKSYVEEGKTFTVVLLADGTLITLAGEVVPRETPETPRETGS